MKAVQQVMGDSAPAVARKVLDRWNRMIPDEPWWSTHQVDSRQLAELIRRSADVAFGESDEEAMDALVALAMEHGRGRRGDGHKDTVVHQEFLLLRRALHTELVDRIGASPSTHAALARVNAVLNHAEIASLHGYHEPELSADSAAKAPARLTQEWLQLRETWPPT